TDNVSYFDNISWEGLITGAAPVLGTTNFEAIEFKAYPNPTRDSWTIKTKNVNMSSIKVFDVLGKNVLSLAPNTSDTIIDGSSLKAGLYFAQIKTETGISSIKLIKK
ncbi:MAG: T9SS type A sorting domain-containing protein, partial [Flavobacteriaceae bacterium]